MPAGWSGRPPFSSAGPPGPGGSGSRALPAARDRAQRLDPDALVEIDNADDVETLAARIQDACDGPLDLVVDPLFGIPCAAALGVLRPHGRLVDLGGSAGELSPITSSMLRGQ